MPHCGFKAVFLSSSVTCPCLCAPGANVQPEWFLHSLLVYLCGVTPARVRWIFIRPANPSDSLRLSFEYYKPKYCADVSCEFDEFRVDTHLCKLRTKSIAHLDYIVCSIRKSNPEMTLYYVTYHILGITNKYTPIYIPIII